MLEIRYDEILELVLNNRSSNWVSDCLFFDLNNIEEDVI